jgi:outer membrane protein OmpA-like peptidoglycan-associated protein
MSSRALIPSLAVSLIFATGLSGCLTPQVQPTPSQAVVQARSAAGAKPAACTGVELASISPVDMAFGFDDATISEAGQKRLAQAAAWLGCNPGIEVVIIPDADSHGDAAHLSDLAGRRAQAAAAQLRVLGAKDAVIRLLARGAADPVTAPHLVVNAQGRGW